MAAFDISLYDAGIANYNLLYLDDTLIIEGEGRSKQEAEEMPARKAVELKNWES